MFTSHGYLEIKEKLGHLDAWILGYLDTWIHGGCMDTWIHGYMDTYKTLSRGIRDK